jgi:hypothetical protein
MLCRRHRILLPLDEKCRISGEMHQWAGAGNRRFVAGPSDRILLMG